MFNTTTSELGKRHPVGSVQLASFSLSSFSLCAFGSPLRGCARYWRPIGRTGSGALPGSISPPPEKQIPPGSLALAGVGMTKLGCMAGVGMTPVLRFRSSRFLTRAVRAFGMTSIILSFTRPLRQAQGRAEAPLFHSPAASRECVDAPQARSACMRSFDCAGARSASPSFAQDDSRWGMTEFKFGDYSRGSSGLFRPFVIPNGVRDLGFCR
jgi:hypothetical protein